MKVYILIRDETDFNGQREVFGVYSTYEAAKIIGDRERERAQDWVDTMREVGENVGNWVPSFHIEEASFHIEEAEVNYLLAENERLRAEGGNGAAGGLLDRLEREAEVGSVSSPAPAAPAPVCEWGVTSSGWYQGACNENCKWWFRDYEECPSCGKPIKFTEDKE